MPSVLEKIKCMSRGLYPNGRAFFARLDGYREKLHNAMGKSEAKAHQDALSILDGVLPDSDNFLDDDATDWERRLGLGSVAGMSLQDRMARIMEQYNYPGTDAPRQHYTRLEAQLRDAGFDVHVYENNFSGEAKPPSKVLSPTALDGSYHSVGTYHAPGTRHGVPELYTNIAANYIDENIDKHFIIGANYRFTFFVAGTSVTSFADIPLVRKQEFRQLILTLKPAHTVGFLFVNYI